MADHAIPARLWMIAGQPAVLAHQALAGWDARPANRGRGAVLPRVSRSIWHLSAPARRVGAVSRLVQTARSPWSQGNPARARSNIPRPGRQIPEAAAPPAR